MDNSTKRQSNRGRRRPVNFVLREEDCDGLISFLETLPYGAESKLMRAVLINWFQEQIATHGENIPSAANEMIQNSEIMFLQQRHGIQFAKREPQPKGRPVQAAPVRLSTQTENAVLPPETTQAEMIAVIAAVESRPVPEAFGETLNPVPEVLTSAKQGGMPPAPSNASGDVNVDDILGL